VTSLRSTQIHYGGGFDKVLAIVVTTGVLALALGSDRSSRELRLANWVTDPRRPFRLTGVHKE
jgi:multisubunit Na+/H+ antiporter MnhB subunit